MKDDEKKKKELATIEKSKTTTETKISDLKKILTDQVNRLFISSTNSSSTAHRLKHSNRSILLQKIISMGVRSAEF